MTESQKPQKICSKHNCILLWNLNPSSEAIFTRNQAIAIALGQVASLLITGTGVTSAMLAKNGVAIPTFQSLANYFFLMVVYLSIFLSQIGLKGVWTTFKNKAHIYFTLSLIDVEANFLVVKAYQYTTITSVMLLDCFTIPCVVVLTWFLFKTRYNLRHGLGVVLSVAGLVVLIYSDIGESQAQNHILGDSLVLIGSILYAISNVGAEKFAPGSQFEYLSMVGFWGCLISCVQAAILERNELMNLNWSGENIALLVGFALCLFSLYSIVPTTIVLGGSALWNISLLTSDVFGVIASIFVFFVYPSNLFYLSLFLTIFGILTYNIKNHPSPPEVDERSLVARPDDTDEHLQANSVAVVTDVSS